jgi:hypothetical protein
MLKLIKTDSARADLQKTQRQVTDKYSRLLPVAMKGSQPFWGGGVSTGYKQVI